MHRDTERRNEERRNNRCWMSVAVEYDTCSLKGRKQPQMGRRKPSLAGNKISTFRLYAHVRRCIPEIIVNFRPTGR